jgi:hypothetical protein
MTAVARGIRNAFRNTVRTISVVAILGLSIGLGFVMLTAYHSVTGQVAATLSSIGNTVTVGPPGYAAGMPLGKNLTTGELAPIGSRASTRASAARRRPGAPRRSSRRASRST